MNHHRQPRRIAAPTKMAENKTRDENPKTPEPIVLGMRHPPQDRRQHDRSDRTKERLRPAAKHETTEHELLHHWRCDTAANHEEQKPAGLPGARIRVRRNLLRADDICGQGLDRQQDRRDRQGAQQFACAWPAQREIFGEIPPGHSDRDPKHGDRSRACYDIGGAGRLKLKRPRLRPILHRQRDAHG